MTYYNLILNSSGGLDLSHLVLTGVSLWHMVWINCPTTWKSRELAYATPLFWGIVSTVPLERRDVECFGSWQVLCSWTQLVGWMLAEEIGLVTSMSWTFKRLNINFFKLSTWLHVMNSPFSLKMEPENLSFINWCFPGFSFLRS